MDKKILLLIIVILLSSCSLIEDAGTSLEESPEKPEVALNVEQPQPIAKQFIDLDVKPVQTYARAGERYSFSTRLTSKGTNNNFQVALHHDIKNKETGSVLISKDETIGLEIIASKRTEVLIPQDTEAGRYILETTASYDSGSADASFEFDIERAVVIRTPQVKSELAVPSKYEHVQVVNITGLGYVPREIKIKKGMWVKWINIDINSHTATGSGFNAVLRSRETFMYQFNESRTYVYTDTYSGIHPGTVTVEE